MQAIYPRLLNGLLQFNPNQPGRYTVYWRINLRFKMKRDGKCPITFLCIRKRIYLTINFLIPFLTQAKSSIPFQLSSHDIVPSFADKWISFPRTFVSNICSIHRVDNWTLSINDVRNEASPSMRRMRTYFKRLYDQWNFWNVFRSHNIFIFMNWIRRLNIKAELPANLSCQTKKSVTSHFTPFHSSLFFL